MTKYRVTVPLPGTSYTVEVEAASEEEAIEQAWEELPQLCHHCSRAVDLGEEPGDDTEVEEL